eukprot:SAG11_NODE_10054_length_860_cov_2.094612_1_plen_144_part_00
MISLPYRGKGPSASGQSFVPPKTGSKVRLFNLAVDVEFAGLNDGSGQQLAHDVQYSLGSQWSQVPLAKQTFSAVSDTSSSSPTPSGSSNSSSLESLASALASVSFAPPAAPQVFTTFLMGSASFGYTLLPLDDAPETGPCKPP